MLALDHGGQIVAQDDLAAGGVLRGDDIDGLVGIHVGKAVLGQLVGKAGADDLCAVQAENGIHDGVVLVGSHQLFCHGLCLGKAGLLGGDIDIVIDVAVAGCEMALCHTQEQIALVGGKLYHVDHNCNTPVLSNYKAHWPFSGGNTNSAAAPAAALPFFSMNLWYQKMQVCTRYRIAENLKKN